ncbi:class I SAM-dependent methyltransferase [Roseomonas marmotae]|uniref:Class I SAM-dependent methyltransferase n=1 Tax=Roseomonas marmotae TaxID=2768161 RepID=A0ABS3K7K0_9PROT|nr:class I SAM-dependent methyltransferase [Roseomonas marmotae]MBO1073410.1 class I SAM-dependent methyltransferase [Roseomonas marmotae]QTI80392.1 class I SAM-dependent methyltransferase [Roseomonas marmotae]
MPFPTDDRAWNDTLLYLLERRRPGERTLAPEEFADELPFVRPYSQQDEGEEPAYAWVVVHKGMTNAIKTEFLRQLTSWAVPVFANEVFVVFAREPGFAMTDLSDTDHVKSLLNVLPQREGASEPAPPAPAPEEAAPSAPVAAWMPAPAAAPVAEVEAQRSEAWSAPAGGPEDAEPLARPAPAAPPASGPNRLRHQEVRRLLRDYLGDTPGQRLLDLGCGTGRFAGLFTEAKVLGVDPRPEQVETARASHGGLPNFRFMVGDPARLDLSEPPFDVVLLVDALPTGMADSATLLQRAASHTRPGGLLFLTVDNSGALNHRVARLSGQAPQGGFTLAEVTGMVRAAGFQPLRADGLLLPWPGQAIEDEGILDTLRELGRLVGPTYAEGIALLARRS